MKKIGITGGIGSGKSTIANIFNKEFGIPIFYSDKEVKLLYDNNEHLRQQLIENFGKDIYINNIFNRKLMASIIFNDKEKLNLISTIVSPILEKEFNNWCLLHSKKPFILYESAILIESGFYKKIDDSIFVSCPLEIRIQRAMKRDYSSREDILKRVNNQMDDTIKQQYCKYLILNEKENDANLLKSIKKTFIEINKNTIYDNLNQIMENDL